MSNIAHKLRSKRGGSMIIAMVFMIFCVFIGGTVLAAASANGYRVAHLSDQQQYLDQRSAAMLLSDEMDIPDGSSVRLVFKDKITTKQPVIISAGGIETNNGDPTQTRELVIDVGAEEKVNACRRLMVETAILRFLLENEVNTANVPVTITNFVYDDGTTDGKQITSVGHFWCSATNGTITVTGTTGSTEFAQYPVFFSCAEGNRLYDFVMAFDDPTSSTDDELSQLTVTMNGFSSVITQIGQPQYQDSVMVGENEQATRLDVVVDRTTIGWNDPVIAKGGAEE